MLGVLLIIFGLLIALLGVWHVLPTDAMATTNSSAWQTILNGITGLATLALVIVTVFMVWYTRCSLEEAQKANERLEKMFIAQIRPLVDVVPRIVVFSTVQENTFLETILSVTNYSGFDAKKISVDVKYGDGEWIAEWLNAVKRASAPSEKLKELAESYSVSPAPIENLTAGAGTEVRIRGQVPTDAEFREANFRVRVRARWENDKAHLFDEIHDYYLEQTTAGGAKSFTFIPAGTVTKRDSGSVP